MLDVRKIITAARDMVGETFWPTRCIGCDLPGTLLCPDCKRQLPHIRLSGACARCGAPHAHFTCTECPAPGSMDHEGRLLPPAFAFCQARAACSYEGVAKRLVTAYKDGDEARLAPLIAQELARCIRGREPDGSPSGLEDWTYWADALVPIPAGPASLRKRGYDHLLPIAQAVSQSCGLPLLQVLESRKVADQRLLSSSQRAANRAGSFRVHAGMTIPEHVLLLDDVLTTGATCSAAAAALQSVGACEVRVAVFARVW